jgi:hypothetical protein
MQSSKLADTQILRSGTRSLIYRIMTVEKDLSCNFLQDCDSPTSAGVVRSFDDLKSLPIAANHCSGTLTCH